MIATDARPARILRTTAGCLALMAFAATSLPSDGQAVEDEEVFHLLGIAVGRSLTEFQLSDDELAVIIESMSEVVAGKAVSDPTDEQMKKVAELRNARVAKLNESFIEKVKMESGAQVQDSGLIYLELEPGSGRSPNPTDTVKVHYEGKLTNGVLFDSSVKRGEPAEFPLNRVIACWTEGVAMMKVGGKARLVCPPHIAYGDRGSPPSIPGGAVLSFEVELLEIKAPAPSAAG